MKTLAFWGIFAIPVFWGIGFPLTHNSVQHFSPGLFAFYRQAIAAVCLLPLAIKYRNQINLRVIIGGFFISLWATLSIVCQSYALATTSSAMTAFFVTLNILFVPFLAFVFRLSAIKLVDVITVVLGVISIFVTFHGSISNLETGNLFAFVAAFAIAMNIITVQIITKHATVNKSLLIFFSVLFGMCFLAYFPLNSNNNILLMPASVGWSILYLGGIATALAYMLQITFQKQVGATRTAIILNLDLVFAGLFGLINGESLTLFQVIGGAIALFAS